MLNMIFNRDDGIFYNIGWIPLIYHVTMEGTIFNWSYILANSLSSCITATQEGFLYWKFEFYMGSFLINSILFLNPFERLNYSWKEGKSPIFLAYQLLWTHKYHISYKLICEELLIPLYQLIFLSECKCMYEGAWEAIMEYGDYLFSKEETYLRMYGGTKPLRSF